MTTIRPGCVICAQPFVTGDYPDIYAWLGPGEEQCAAHGSCLERVGDPVSS